MIIGLPTSICQIRSWTLIVLHVLPRTVGSYMPYIDCEGSPVGNDYDMGSANEVDFAIIYIKDGLNLSTHISPQHSSMEAISVLVDTRCLGSKVPLASEGARGCWGVASTCSLPEGLIGLKMFFSEGVCGAGAGFCSIARRFFATWGNGWCVIILGFFRQNLS